LNFVIQNFLNSKNPLKIWILKIRWNLVITNSLNLRINITSFTSKNWLQKFSSQFRPTIKSKHNRISGSSLSIYFVRDYNMCKFNSFVTTWRTEKSNKPFSLFKATHLIKRLSNVDNFYGKFLKQAKWCSVCLLFSLVLFPD